MDIRSSEQARGSKVSGQALPPGFTKRKGLRLLSVEPKSPPACSDRAATGPSAMLPRQIGSWR